MKSFTITQMRPGDQASMAHSFSQADVEAYARISGDSNPAHLDEDYAQGTFFKTRIVHGMLTASLFSAILGTQLPGLGTIFTNQSLQFRKPVYPGEPLVATVTVRELIVEKNRVILDCEITNAQGERVITGECTVLAPKEKKEEPK